MDTGFLYARDCEKRAAYEDGYQDAVNKACEWLMKYFVFDHDGMSASGCDVFLRKFRKAMED